MRGRTGLSPIPQSLAPAFLTRRQDAQNLLQSLAHLLDSVRGLLLGEGQARLFACGLGFILQLLARARDGETLVVEQFLDVQHIFHVTLAVHALAGAALYRLQLGKLRLPKAQDIGWQLAQAGDFSDAEVELVRN